MNKLLRAIPFFLIYLILIGTVVAVIFWPKSEVVVEENALHKELVSTAKAIERSSNSLNNVLLKTRAGMEIESRMYSIVAEELRSHGSTLEYYLEDPSVANIGPLAKQVRQASESVDKKFNLAMQFSQHNAQLSNAIKRGRELGAQVAEIIVSSADLDAIQHLDTSYQLLDALNNWANFNQQKDGDFILANIGKFRSIEPFVEKDQYKIIQGYTRSLEAAVREQRKTNELLDDAVSMRTISPARVEQALIQRDFIEEPETTQSFSTSALLIILAISLITNIAHTFLLFYNKKQALYERQFLRNKTARVIKRARANIFHISDRLQDTADGFKFYYKLNKLSSQITELWNQRKKDPRKADELISVLVNDYTKHSKRISARNLQKALVECTTELDEFDQELHRMRHDKYVAQEPAMVAINKLKILKPRKRQPKSTQTKKSDEQFLII